MGLFSSQRRNSVSASREVDHGKVFVFARSSTPASQHGEGSIEPDILWSLAVTSTGCNLQQSQHDFPVKRRMSIFGMRRASRKGSAASDMTDDHNSTMLRKIVDEYSLQDGALNVSHGKQLQVETDAIDQTSLLVKIQLKHIPPVLLSGQTLSTRIEQILYAMTSVNSHLLDEESETWIRYALISLQHAKILPHGHIFNVDSFINFVQNKTTEFEAELLSSSTCDLDNTEVVKKINYQQHLEENARLKALLGYQPAENLDDDDTSRQSSVIDGRPGVRGGFGGGFWISRPHGATQMKDDNSVYGGLV